MVCEDASASNFLKAELNNKDIFIYVQTSDLNDIQSVLGADIYCNRSCKSIYMLRYEKLFDKQSSPELSFDSSKTVAFFKQIDAINIPLKDGHDFSRSTLEEKANKLCVVTLVLS